MKLILVVVVAMVGMVAQASPQRNPDRKGDGYIDKDEFNAIIGFPGVSDKCWTAMLTMTDKDGDNKVTDEELVAARANGPPKECNLGGGRVDEPAPEPNNNGGGASYDRNNDGYISKDELNTMLGFPGLSDNCWKAMLTMADTDGDNKLTFLELGTASANGPPKECNLGGGGDGGVDETAPEPINNGEGASGPNGDGSNTGPIIGLINPYDRNNDGYINKDELVAMRGGQQVTNKCWKAVLKSTDRDGDNKLTSQELVAVWHSDPPKECSLEDGGDSGVDEPEPNNTGGGPSGPNGDGSNTGPNGPCKCTCLPGKNSYTCTCACQDID